MCYRKNNIKNLLKLKMHTLRWNVLFYKKNYLVVGVFNKTN